MSETVYALKVGITVQIRTACPSEKPGEQIVAGCQVKGVDDNEQPFCLTLNMEDIQQLLEILT